MADTPLDNIVTPVVGGPVSSVANAIGDVALLITKALPGTEQQLAAFKIRSPKIYARIMEHLYQRDKIFLRWHPKCDIDTEVDFRNMDLPESAIADLKKLLHEDLGR